MLGEGFLRLLRYREEKKFASRQNKTQTHSHRTDSYDSTDSTESTDLQADPAKAGPNQKDSTPAKGLEVVSQGPVGLSIPGSSPDFRVCVDDCSLLDQYPDLQVADSGRISNNPLRATLTQHDLYSPVSADKQPEWAVKQDPQDDPVSPMPDQGYLVMGASVNISLDLPDTLEPMSNSALNGLLDKQLEEVYMQHLTDNLARCNSHLGNSLLHGLVPPPQPCNQPHGSLVSLEDSVEEGSEEDGNKKISYLSTQNFVPFSSNFSSPVLRISEADNPHLQ
ncbi:uncharacterized protein si:dkey-237j10.2 [Channa argus]|uniref:uncharacterized protein si:dkey-237j10.2 n=1 Tax=Channa argus TaxID=215402 RepID=UPI002944405E|nr:hypothetical protein Q8A73_010537 [Channa argus]